MDTFATAVAAAPAAPPPMIEAEVETAQVSRSETALTFQIPGRVDVPDDRSPHKVTVGIFRVKPEFDFVAVPKLASMVFRRAKVVNGSPFTLLPGPVRLFEGDDFIGGTDMPQVAPTQPHELFFGVDDRLTVDRGVVRQDVSKTMLTGRRRLQVGYEVRLRNHLPTPAKVTVVDHYPLSGHEDVKVIPDVAVPKPSRQDDLNTLIWNLTLAAGEETKIHFDFVVEHPQAMGLAVRW